METNDPMNEMKENFRKIPICQNADIFSLQTRNIAVHSVVPCGFVVFVVVLGSEHARQTSSLSSAQPTMCSCLHRHFAVS